MRTLAKPKPKIEGQKTKQIEKKQPKQQSKKVMKTEFKSPFRYKIQLLPNEDSQKVISILIEFAKQLRKQHGSQIKPMKNQKFIKFASKVAQQKPTLVVPHLIYGIKQSISHIKRQDKLKLVLIFYEQNQHDNFEQLMCNCLYYKIPYIVLRQSESLRNELGIKKLLSLGISDEDFASRLLLYSCKCLIEIPWLVDTKWIPLA